MKIFDEEIIKSFTSTIGTSFYITQDNNKIYRLYERSCNGSYFFICKGKKNIQEYVNRNKQNLIINGSF